ncbi:phosphate ABC transporter permease subunit PstC [Campylobacter fetus]|uniref:Phosphate transport system permease protein n=1 Tax=Campylobacter fetus subsp. testudinum TaxID=1507806 RepID=A0AAX0H9V0_CAMFE|nr:phosphate ABC transporter permease subunit PstC [Campylobacter fetus]AGZ81080.1 phosphate ABC transporter, permease protein [Campylobacter fetus subsp. testudinum 03-427]AJB44836.1 phosphate transporter permease subunit PstC [Campylobacter fetus subsp. testudinum]ALV64174.1 phosphate ABC transporter, permease protein [Campylobacter fetus subsp. testudinum Sp3]AVK80458.1 phosphate ABC transporter permease subunit PstC [Campylobacter fetus subsp. testudinum]EAI4322816.1 phosphate ABC transpor
MIKIQKNIIIEKLFFNAARVSTIIVLVVLLAIFLSLVYKAYPAISKFGINFLFDTTWDANIMQFGGLASIYGTIVSTFIAMILATPVAIGIAIFLTEVAPYKIRNFFSVNIELLAAIPSIVYGMWGFIYFVPLVRGVFGGSGFGLLSGGMVLAVMVLPFIASVSRDAMATTPQVLKESAYALGATKFDTIKDVVFPYAKAGIIGSIILALGRAFGETMAVAFLLGGISKIPSSITEPATSIPVTLATQFGEAMGNEIYESSLFYLALILFVISFISIATAKFLFLRKRESK